MNGFGLRRWSIFTLVVVVSFAAGAYRLQHAADTWSPDASIYLQMALHDRGLSQAEATDAANRFMQSTNEGRDDPQFYTAAPPAFFSEQHQLFSNRPLYPAVAALLPTSAPRALKTISALAYALVPIVVFAILLGVVPVWVAALAALGTAAQPLVYELSGHAVTDELALLFWVSAFGALVAYLHRPRAVMLLALVVLTAALAWTRPAIYLPLGAAFTAVLTARAAARRSALAALAAIGCVALAFVAYSSATHGATLLSELRWDYAWQHARHGPYAQNGLAAWWLKSFARALPQTAIDFNRNVGVFTAILAALAFAVARKSPLVAAAAGGLMATLLGLIGNPFDFAVERTVILPAIPICIMLAALSVGALAQNIALARSARERLPASSNGLTSKPVART
jgi:hypothetical protein